ncbi:MAG TPA: DegT/DnrJ/EryC1/StrS family aminotransferase [Solirubrobacteraceae bacterium]|nr:DegT/DnrJ/EryC1/StrS family aminotransferase [Solirubrobacteraceae bacterium]
MAAGGTQTSVPFMDLQRHHAPIASELRAAFDRVLGASAFILGEEVERFEARFAELCGVRHCVGVASGTAALVIMLEAAGIGPGDEVIVPAHTFIATALAVKQVGAVPICADVEIGTGLLDPAAVAATIGPRTAAILPVHLYGQVCAMDHLRSMAERYSLALFEDAAQAHGATFQGRPAGGLGTAGAFSFYPSKNLGALGDGGAICTNDDTLAEAARRLRDLGRLGHPAHKRKGYNERLDGLQAAFLAVKLNHLVEWNEARRSIAAHYREALSGVELLEEWPESPCIFHLFPIRVEGRDELAAFLAERGIATGVHYPVALPDQPALEGIPAAGAHNARIWAQTELSLPIFPELRVIEIGAVVAGVDEWLTARQLN